MAESMVIKSEPKDDYGAMDIDENLPEIIGNRIPENRLPEIPCSDTKTGVTEPSPSHNSECKTGFGEASASQGFSESTLTTSTRAATPTPAPTTPTICATMSNSTSNSSEDKKAKSASSIVFRNICHMNHTSANSYPNAPNKEFQSAQNGDHNNFLPGGINQNKQPISSGLSIRNQAPGVSTHSKISRSPRVSSHKKTHVDTYHDKGILATDGPNRKNPPIPSSVAVPPHSALRTLTIKPNGKQDSKFQRRQRKTTNSNQNHIRYIHHLQKENFETRRDAQYWANQATSSQTRIEELILDLKAAEAERDEAFEREAIVTRRCKELNRQHRVSLNKKDKTLRLQGAWNQDLAAEMSKLQLHNNDLKSNLAISEKNLAAYIAQVSTLTKSQAAQDHGGLFLDSAEWQPEDDSSLRQRLKLLEKGVKDWSKRFSVSRLPESIPPETNKTLSLFWRSYDGILDHQLLNHLGNRSAPLLLGAWLADFLYRYIISDPTFHLGSRSFECSDQTASYCVNSGNDIIREHWKAILAELQNSGFAEAQILRVQLLRLLQPNPSSIAKLPSDGERTNRQSVADRTLKAKEKACLSLSCEFYQHVSSLLAVQAGATENEARANLQKLFIKAAGIASSLWAQNRHFIVVTMEDLPRLFHHSSQRMQAHPMHNSLLDDNPGCLDSKPIVLVTHPALLAYGNGDGSGHRICRILAKATVWMGN